MKPHAIYADGTLVDEACRPLRIRGPDLRAGTAPHTVIRWDVWNSRVYQAREYAMGKVPVRDIDFTNPVDKRGRMYKGHPGPPHQHRWRPVDPHNLKAGYIRERRPEVFP